MGVIILYTQPASAELFISEYVEGSSYNKAVEIYNGTGNTVDLSSYELQFYFNGNTSAGRTVALSGSLANGQTYVVAEDAADPALRDQADQLDTSTSWYNGDDAVVLVNGGAVADSIGHIGFDPGSEWGSGNTSTQNNTLRRKVSICAGDTDPYDIFDPANEWDGYAQDTFDGVGSHSVNCGGEPPPPPPGGDVFIHDVQGSGDSSPLDGQSVLVEAIVVGDFQGSGALNGFYIQEEDADVDNDPATSEGVFVYQGASGTDVNVGDLVQVTGTVSEYYTLTELTSPTVTIISSGNPLPGAAQINLPLTNIGNLERYEGMRVSLPQTLTVTENYDLGRYGELWLSSGGRLMAPTNIALPGSDALAQQAANDLNRILLDDGSTVQNPDPVVYPSPELTAFNTLRSGDSVTGVTGVMHFAFDYYRIHPTQTPAFVQSNARTSEPASIGGSLKVASFNVLNYFNGDGQGGGFPTSRGADTVQEFNRQRDKIIAAISSMNADIVGLMEIENDGYGSNSAIADLVNGLNRSAPEGTGYAFINPGVGQIGSDEIAVGIIYRTETVAPVGNATILDSSVDSRFIDTKNRPTLVQTFEEIASGGRINVAVNHLKSKGSACDDVGDPDTGDGQGNCNQTRTSAAQALVDWLATDPTNSGDNDFLIIGDLNSYAKEDPVTAIKNGGYVDLVDTYIGADSAYSYIFMGQAGYLDHALAAASLASQVTGVAEWHINTDEPRALDYNTEFKSAGQITSLYNADAYRASDHDPVLIGLNLDGGAPPADNPPTTVSVSDLDGTATWISSNRWQATVVVTVVNELGETVQDATVTATWTGKRRPKTEVCTTGTNGQCQFTERTSSVRSWLTLTVNDISHATLSYNSAGNADPDGDSDGTVVTVTRP
ncbi:MAG: ExeM/NucH family extracellular endonuclease [Gammaproteobacteria bacterium]